MSQQVTSENALQALDQARRSVDSVKSYIRDVQSNQRPQIPNLLTLTQNVGKADMELQKAERLVEHMKEKLKQAAVVSARTKESINPSSGVKRALAAIQSAQQSPKKLTEDPSGMKITEQSLTKIVEQLSMSSPLIIRLATESIGIRMECKNVFVAFLWFTPDANQSLVPECSNVFGVEEKFNRWRTSQYQVFGILTERASAAISYYWAIESHASTALQRFLGWLELHQTIFSDVSFEDNRRLAFDASRAIFLPPCVRAFDGDRRPRHPRACVPERQERTERIQNQPMMPQQAAQQGGGTQVEPRQRGRPFNG